MRIVRLGDHPELVGEVASWIYQAFPYAFEGESEQDWLHAITHGQLDGSMTTFVALEDGAPVATASLDLADLPSHPHLSPWLASVYTLPEHRGKGLAGALFLEIEKEARARGFRQLYLYTTDQEALYRKRGWETLEDSRLAGESIVVMYKMV